MGIGIIDKKIVIVGLVTIFFTNGSSTHQRVRSKANAIKLLPNEDTCGIQNIHISDRIFGGSATDIDEHPWAALLLYRIPNETKGEGKPFCGGTLISSRYVLTVAHCVVKKIDDTKWSKWWQKNELTHVRLGEWDRTTNKDCLMEVCSDPPIDVPVKKIITHEGYNPLDIEKYNDISLVRLGKKVEFTDFIKPICLPLADDLREATFNGYDMEVVGWGLTENRTQSNVKLKVRVPVMDNKRCNVVFKRTHKFITRKQICAGGNKGEDSCGNDSGNALMGRVPPVDNWLAIGLVSYGRKTCGEVGSPTVHTKVGAYVDWILSKLEP